LHELKKSKRLFVREAFGKAIAAVTDLTTPKKIQCFYQQTLIHGALQRAFTGTFPTKTQKNQALFRSFAPQNSTRFVYVLVMQHG
jgi:hypothetical protein